MSGVVVGRISSCVQPGPVRSERSFGNVIPFPSKPLPLRGWKQTLHRFKAQFPDLWSALIRENHDSVAEVAVFYGVTPKTAENWWHGQTGGAGCHVALAARSYPESFNHHMLPQQAAA